MELLVAEVVDLFYHLLWPMVRVSAFLIAVPLFSLQAVSLPIRILLALTLTWMIYPLSDWPLIDPISAAGLRELFNQVFIGVVMGLILQVVNAALVVGGQAISASMGLSMANLVDPNMGNVPVIAQFLLICSTLIFLGLGGHVLVISMLLESFNLVPIGVPIQLSSLFDLVIKWSAMIFLGGVLLAMPILVTLLFINIGLGVITRAAPALNIFAVGFPAMILAGILLLSMAMPAIGFRIQWLWQRSFDILNQLLAVI
jgi:flagellar biosynthetic protein FliR